MPLFQFSCRRGLARLNSFAMPSPTSCAHLATGAIFFKNLVRQHWEGEEGSANLIPDATKQQAQAVP
eukprot:2695602-Pleurochrysis_carterae.AAC.1